MRCILRPLLFFQSIFYLVIGVALLTWSIIYGEAKFSEWNGSDLSYFAVANIVAGAIILFLGLLGFITSCTGSYSWSYTYSIIILIFIILQCIAGIVLIIFRSGADDKMVMMLKETIGDYKSQMETLYYQMVQTFWDFFQTTLECCGADSAQNWNETVPDSCKSAGEPRETATVGCWDALADMLSLHKVPVILTCVGVFVIQVFGVCFSCCLARSVQVDHYDFN